MSNDAPLPARRWLRRIEPINNVAAIRISTTFKFSHHF